MRIILSEDGIAQEERKMWRQVLFSNMKIAFRIICDEMNERGLGFSCQTSVVSTTAIEWSKAVGS